MPPAWRSFLLSLLAFLPVVLLVFLWDCSFFVAWQGQAVSVAPSRAEQPASFVVRIHEGGESRAVRTVNWDAAVVKQLSLPVDAIEMAPIEIPETAPDTEKARFGLSYRVDVGSGDTAKWLEVPTTSPRSLGIAALVFLLLAAVRNMVVAGSPFALEPIHTKNATAAPPSPSGQPSGPPKAGRSQKGPPPGKRRRGRGRR